jgi:putative ABC transport system ATP-binding protein
MYNFWGVGAMLAVKNLSKIYDDGTAGLEDFSFSFKTRGLYCIVGESGSGKSTLLHLLASLLEPSSGEISYRGKPYSEIDLNKFRRYEIGVVFQDFNLIKRLSVKENLKLPLALFKTENPDAEIREVLRVLDLEGHENKAIAELSGGETQRVAIARTLLKKPRVLLLDEPTSNLDSENSRHLFGILEKLADEYLIIASTHNLELAEEYADHIIELCDGRLVSEKAKRGIREVKSEKEYPKSKRIYFEIFKLIFKQKYLRKLLFVLMIAFSLAVYAIGIVNEHYDKNLDILVTNRKYFNDELRVGGYYEKIEFSDGNAHVYRIPKEYHHGDYSRHRDALLKGIKNLDYDTDRANKDTQSFYNGGIDTTILIPEDYVIPNILYGRSIEKPGEIVITDYVAENIIHYKHPGMNPKDLV